MSTDSNSGNPNTTLLAGATGLVGGLCLQRLLAGSDFDKVVAVVRRPIAIVHDRLQVVVTEFDQLHHQQLPPAGAALSALGTTAAKAGSKQEFRKVDHDATVAFAWAARTAGARTFVLVSAAGAAPQSPMFYLKIKGETEEDVSRVGFPRVVILRPGFLEGQRREHRRKEELTLATLKWMNPVLRGPLRRFRPISAEQVAIAMLVAARGDQPGRFIWENDEIEAAASGKTTPTPHVVMGEPQQTGA